MTGLLDFLTLCNMGILFNTLDRRTYGEPDEIPYESIYKNKYDYNTIPDSDRRAYVYARGISLDLISWLNSRLVVTGVEGNADPQERLEIKDLQVQYITRQGLTMLQYLENWIAEEKKKEESHFPNVDIDSLGNQLSWAMDTIPWMETSWSDAKNENDESFYLRSLYPASGQPVSREEMQTYKPWSKTIFLFCIIIHDSHFITGREKKFRMGLTEGDKMFFEGTEAFYGTTFYQTKDTVANGSAVGDSLKRKSGTPAESLTKSKRHHASQQ
jgi:hypothetical protein